MKMEELHMAASAYYKNASPEVKKLAEDFFYSMDTDQDGQVSIDEFTDFFKQLDDSMDRSFFAAFDRNGNGSLQFEEVLTLNYIIITGQTGRNMVSFFSHVQLGNHPFVNEILTINR
jgi:Ca2+-binding EF-hand superfamily protein